MQPRLIIDLNAVAANYRLLRVKAGPAICAGVVKGDGYGIGAEPIAKRLYQEGCRIFFTAGIDEALTLRPHLRDAIVYVLAGLCGAKPVDFSAQSIRPVLNEAGEIREWAKHEAGNCILHIDTGMNRLGLPPDALKYVEGLKPDFIMSHLANGERPDDAKNAEQKAVFDAILREFPGIPASLAATASIFMGQGYCYDLARPGIGLYGGNPFTGRPNPMQDVIRIDAPILQIRTLAKGETVGYGATFTAGGGERIATLGVGYADGFGRPFDNCGIGELDGYRVRLAGRVSMDYLTFDVSNCPENMLRIGKFITLLGGPVPVDEALNAAKISPYHFFTGLGRRFNRQYISD